MISITPDQLRGLIDACLTAGWRAASLHTMWIVYARVDLFILSSQVLTDAHWQEVCRIDVDGTINVA